MPTVRTKSDRFDLYQHVTDAVVAALESGTCPWRKPWDAPGAVIGGHRSVATGKAYRGCNQFLLAMVAASAGYTSPWWMTYRQAEALGGHVRKGERSHVVVYWTFIDAKPAKGQPAPAPGTAAKRIPILRYFRVFNVAQVDGLPADVAAKYGAAAPVPASLPGAPMTDAEAAMSGTLGAYVARSGVTLAHGGASAHYRPSTDHVQMPEAATFRTHADYLHTLAHECAHSTGAAKRLNRDGVTKCAAFGSATYSREELVAELAAAFVAGAHGASTPDVDANRDAYLANWAKALRDDPRAIVVAAGAAQRAAEYVIGDDADDAPADAADVDGTDD